MGFLGHANPFLLFSSLTDFLSRSYEAWLPFFVYSVLSRPSYSSFCFLSGWQDLFIFSGSNSPCTVFFRSNTGFHSFWPYQLIYLCSTLTFLFIPLGQASPLFCFL